MCTENLTRSLSSVRLALRTTPVTIGSKDLYVYVFAFVCVFVCVRVRVCVCLPVCS